MRNLSPIQGRWWTPDPAGLAAVDPSNPQSWNAYAYVNGDPLEETDPLGLFPCGPHGATDCLASTTAWAPKDDPSLEQDLLDLILATNQPRRVLFGHPPIFVGVVRAGRTLAPNNAANKPTFLSCTFTGKVGLSYLTFGLDAVGTIPVGNDVVHGVQFGAGIAAAGISLFGGATGAGLSAGGLGLAFADKSGVSIAVHGVELIPVAGNIISAGAALNDIFGGDGIIASYESCFAGTN